MPGRATTEDDELRRSDVAAYLRARGVVKGCERVEELPGGVSGRVYRAWTGASSVVVKQARHRLAVAGEWRAPAERVLAEAQALELLHALTPTAVPAVLDVDADRLAMTIEAAPVSWRDWRSELLGGRVQEHVAARTGALLAGWHAATPGGAGCPPRVVDGAETFEILRLRPFFTAVAEREPDLAARIEGVATRTRDQTRTSVVHGDLSPKNLLVDPTGDGLWVIDMEVAHVGDPTFDLAFMLSHLLLKVVHLPERRASLRAAASAFVRAYREAGGADPEPDHLSDQIACLALARVRGTSPAGYLTTVDQAVVTATARDLLVRPATEVEELFARDLGQDE